VLMKGNCRTGRLQGNGHGSQRGVTGICDSSSKEVEVFPVSD
jgi:hypothetical protein